MSRDDEWEAYYAERDAQREAEEAKERERRYMEREPDYFGPLDQTPLTSEQRRQSDAVSGALGGWVVYCIGFVPMYWAAGIALSMILSVTIYGPCHDPCDMTNPFCVHPACPAHDFGIQMIKVLAAAFLPAVPISGIFIAGGIGTSSAQRWTLFGAGVLFLLTFGVVWSLFASMVQSDLISQARGEVQLLAYLVLGLIALLACLRVFWWMKKLVR
jgi:hypothetical protein